MTTIISNYKTLANPSGPESLPNPRILSVEFDKHSITPGDWVTITIKITNDGPVVAPYQTIHLGLPHNPEPSDIQILYADLDLGTEIYPAGSTLGGPYGPIKSFYTIIEGIEEDLEPGQVRTLVVKVRIPDRDSLWFDIKTVACDKSWKILNVYPKTGLVDQQGEFVETYVLVRYNSVIVEGGKWNMTRIAISNPDRHSPLPQPEITISSIEIVEEDAFPGSITPLNIPINLAPGMSSLIELNVTAPIEKASYYFVTFTLNLNVDKLSYQATGRIGILVRKPMSIFIGRVEEINTNTLVVNVSSILKTTKDLPRSVRVIYDPHMNSVILGKIMKGDELLIYGYPDDEIKVTSPGYGILNLAYGAKETTRFKLLSEFKIVIPVEKTLDTPLGTLYMSTSLKTIIRDEIEVWIERYGFARNEAPLVLVLTPGVGRGIYDIRLEALFSVSEYSLNYEKTYSSDYILVLGEETSFSMPRISIPVVDTLLAKLEVGVTLNFTFKPTRLLCIVEPKDKNLIFDTPELSLKHGLVIMDKYTQYVVPSIFLGNSSTIMSIECDLEEVNWIMELVLDARVVTSTVSIQLPELRIPIPGSEKTYVTFEPISYSVSPANLLTVEVLEDLGELSVKIDDIDYRISPVKPLRLALRPGEYKLKVPEVVSLTDSARFRFLEWNTGELSNSLTLNIQNDTTVYPIYVREYKIVVSSEGCGTVVPSGEHWVIEGEKIAITAQAYSGCTIKEWLINGESQHSTSTQLEVLMDKPQTVKVIFEKMPLTIPTSIKETPSPNTWTYYVVPTSLIIIIVAATLTYYLRKGKAKK